MTQLIIIKLVSKSVFRLSFLNSYQSVLVDEAEAVQSRAAVGTLEVIVLMLQWRSAGLLLLEMQACWLVVGTIVP